MSRTKVYKIYIPSLEVELPGKYKTREDAEKAAIGKSVKVRPSGEFMQPDYEVVEREERN